MAAWLRYDWCSSLVLALGHFLWQGVLLAALLAVVLKATKNVAVRYWLSLSALLLMAACPVATLAWLAEPASPVEIPAVVDVIAEPLEPTPLVTQSLSGPDGPDLPMPIEVESSPHVPDVIPEPVTSMPVDQRSWWQRFAPQLTTAYASGVGLMLLRLAVGLWGGRRLCRRAIPVTDGSLLSALQRQSTALGLKLQPLLAYCERVTVPTVVGVLKPMILLPVSIASGLSPEQIESVLAHELAHLRRYDHLVNLLQRVIESLLFFHPAVWWVSHRVREEREHCCDDLVIACGAMPLDYAKSLLRVAELSRASRLGRSISAISLLATGDKPSNLRQRIARLLGESATPSLRLSPRVLMFALCAPVIALLASLQSGASNALRGKPDEAEVAKDLTPRPESYVAALANGMRVEFVGLAAMEPDAKNWWKPDGSPLNEVPAHDNATSSVSGRKMRRVLIRVHGKLSSLDVTSQGMSTLRRRDDQDADGPFVRLDGGYACLPGEKAGRIEVGIATQPQSAVRRLDAKGGATDGSPAAGGIKFDSVGLPALWISKSNGQELPETAEQKKENDQRRVQTQVLWSAPKSLRTFDLDLTLIDVDGKAHQPAGRGSYFETDETRRQQINRGTFVFDVPISRVAGFEYRTRLYQHWVTFENVSLQRDELTDVTIKVESDAFIESQPVVPQLTENFSDVLTGQQADQVAWSHDSKELYATGSFQKLTVWKRSESGWKPTTLDRDSFKNSIAASQKSPLMVVGTNLGSAEVWDAATQKRLQLFQPSPQYSVYAVAISADDKLVAACGTNGTVRVFDRETQRPIALLAEPDHARMSGLAFSPDGKMLAAMDRHGYVALWTIPEGKPLAQWPKIAGEDCSVFWSRDSKQLAVSGWGSVTLIAAERGSQPKVVQAPEELLSRHPADEGGLRSGPQPGGIKFASIPAISADLRTIASIAPDGNIGLWDVAHSGVIAKLQSPNAALIKDAPGGGLRHLTFSPDGLNLACTNQRGEIVIWQLAQNKTEAGKVQPGAAVDPEEATVDPTKPAAQPAATSALPKGLEFLAPYPKLHGLSLDMTEPQFLEIVKQQELKTRKTGEGDMTAYHMGLGDGLTLIVMFRNDGTCRGIQRIRGEEAEEKVKPPVIGAVIQLNPLPVVGDFSKVDDPDVLLDQLAKGPLPSLEPQSGGGFFQQEGAPPQALYVNLWESQYAGNDKLDPRIRRLIELGDRAVPRVLQRLNGLAASDALATHLTLVLRSAGTTESVPALIKLLKTSPSTVLDGTLSLDDAQKNFQASVTQVAATSALWKLTGRKHVFTPDQWEKWWQSVKPDFVVPRERQRPEFVSRVTLERVNSLANDLATNEVAARERLISLGPVALPHLLTLLATEPPKPPLDSATLDAAKLSPQSKRLAWVIDELGATDKLPAKLRRDYFTQRFSNDGTYAGMYPIDEDALCRALSHCSFADYCSVFLEADSQGNVASHMKHIKWPLEIYAAYCRRFSKISPPNLGGWSNNAHWNKVVPAEDPASEIESAVPILLAALKDDRVERRSSAAKLAAAIGFCSTAKPETLIVALRDAWLVEADEKVRPEIAFAMCRFRSPFVVKEVTNGMLSDRPEIVSDCAALMDWIPIQLNDETRPAFERLVELTRHENEKLRNRAVRSLRGKAVQLLNPELLRLSQDQSVDIRKECAYALRDKPDPKFADILFQLADDPNEQVRIEALTSIANLDHPESMNRLVPHLRDKKVHGYAVSALASMGGKDALPLLMSELESGNDVGGMVYQHLRRLTGEKFEGKPEPWLARWKQQKAAPKPGKDSAATSLPDGLEFLRPYPKLHGLSLNMTEPQFLEIIKQQELKTARNVDGVNGRYHMSLGDAQHMLIVMFDKDGKCGGIERVRSEDTSPTSPPNKVYNHPIAVSGRALDEAGKPIPGAKVYLAAVEVDHKRIAETKADADGRYEFLNISLPIRAVQRSALGHDRGAFEVFGTVDGKAFAWRPLKFYYPEPNNGRVYNTYERDVPERFYADEKIVLDLKFTESHSIKGRIVDEQGMPVAGAKLAMRLCEPLQRDDRIARGIVHSGHEFSAIDQPDGVPAEINMRQTDDDGRFEFSGVPAECLFRFDAKHPNYAGTRLYAATTRRTLPKMKDTFTVHTAEIALTLRSNAAAGAQDPRPAQSQFGTFRGVVAIDGVRPTLPPVSPSGQQFTIAGLKEVPDESLLIGKKGGIANVLVYLPKAPTNWIPTPPPTEPLLVESVQGRFTPHASILRVGQKLKLKNSMNELVNFHSKPLRSEVINMTATPRGEQLVDPKHSQSENLPYPLTCDIFPWMQSWILALDHPFMALTDAEGRFEIVGLPPGEHEFRVWHEKGGYLEKNLPIRVTSGQATELALKYGYDFEASKIIPAAKATPHMKSRAERLKANDPEAAKKLVGVWKATLPDGSAFGAEFAQTDDGCLRMKARQFTGTYAVHADRVELLEAGSFLRDLRWERQRDGSLKLIGDRKEVAATNLGAVLERVPADTPQNDARAANGLPELRTLRKPALLLPDHWIMQAVGFDNGGKELVTASNQSFFTIRRWDVAGMKLISEIKLQADKHGRAVHGETMKFSGDRRRVIGATDAYVGIWDATTGKLLKQLPFAPKDGIYTCAIDLLDCTPDLSVIVGHRALPGRLTLSYDAHLIIWDGVSGNVLQTVIDKGATDLKAIDLSTDGKRLVTTNGGGAKIWETSTGQLLRSIPNDNTGRKHSEPDVSSQYTSHVWSVQFSPDSKQVAMGDILGVKLLDTASGKLLQQLEGPYRYSSSGSPGLVFSKDGQWLARLGTQEKVGVDGDKYHYVVPIWSTRTGARLFELHTEANDAAFSDDGQRLAVVFSDMQQALSVWTLSVAEVVRLPNSPQDGTLTSSATGPGPHSRQDRVEENGHYVGKTAAEFIDKFKPVWGDTKHGLQYGIALTKSQRQFRIGERVPLVVFFRNTSDKPVKFNTAPDFFGNVPKVLNAQGEPIALENIPLLGRIPRYHEKLEPGEALGPFYLSFGLGENPRPGQQHWHPYFKTPAAGQYKLTHSAWINVVSPKDGEPVQRDDIVRDDIVTGQIDFEIINGG